MAAANNDNRRRANEPVVMVGWNNDDVFQARRHRRRMLMRQGLLMPPDDHLFQEEMEWMRMVEEQDRLIDEEVRQRRQAQEEEARRFARMLVRRGISSFSQEQTVLGTEFQPHPQEEPTPGLEQVVASPKFDARRLFLKRVTAWYVRTFAIDRLLYCSRHLLASLLSSSHLLFYSLIL